MDAADRGFDEPIVADIEVVADRSRLGEAESIEPLVAQRRGSRIEIHLIKIAAEQRGGEEKAMGIGRVDAGKWNLEIAVEVRSVEILSFRLRVPPGDAHMQRCTVTADVKARQILSQ